MDNPYYFNSADKNNNNNNHGQPPGPVSSADGSPLKTPDVPSRGFASFFRRRSNSSKSLSSPKQCNYVNETQMDQNQFGLNSSPQQHGSPSFCTGQHHQPLRGSFRSALRSKSTNSSVTYSQGIIIGECRPNSATESLKLTNLSGRQRLASYTESTFSYNGSDDVFLPSTPTHREQQATASATVGGHRRHSIGTFTNRLRGGSVSDEVPSMPAPKPPVNHAGAGFSISALRKGGGGVVSRCTTARGTGHSPAMDDILIVTARQSEPAILWANYLKTRFDKITKQRGRVPFNFLHVKLDDTNPTSDIIQRCLATKLQIVIVCSALLKMPQAVLMNQLGGILRPERVLGLLLEVTEEEVHSVHRKCLPCYKQWKRCVVQAQDQNFVGHVLGIATDILGPALRDQPLLSSAAGVAAMNTSTLSRQTSTEGFTLLPKKVKIGQNKVVAILSEPLARDDVIQVRIDKTGDFVDVANVKRRNPYTLQFSVPDECMEVSMMVDVQVIRNDAIIGCRPLKCESRLRELEQILRSPDAPMEFICQSMGVSMHDSNKLDLIMLQAFQKNIPPGFHLLAPSCNGGGGGPEQQGASSMSAQRESSPEEYPTMLHFSARWGLDKLTMQLLECPGGEMAISMRNLNGKTPLDLAEQFSHEKCVEILKNFSQMHEFTTMYHYFKGVSDSAPNKVIVDLKSEMARKTSTVSQVLQVPTSPTVLTSTTNRLPEYMEMHCNSSGSERDNYSAADDIIVSGVTNLNYINVEDSSSPDPLDSVDECDGALGAISSESFTGPETTNELKINEPAYYESKDANKTDQFSVECSNLLDNVDQQQQREQQLKIQQQELMADYLIQPSNRPVTVADGFGDYLTHPSNKPLYPTDTTSSTYMNDVVCHEASHMKMTYAKKNNSGGIEMSCEDELNMSSCSNATTTSSHAKGNSMLKRQESETSKASVDDELLEIINDFKNNVFTINEVEQLVSTWKNRNDVQQSFKDKERQLQKMRDEYDRLQLQMKDRMKRPTPFERVRKLFSRSRSEDKEANESQDSKLFNTSGHRPASSLSLHSVTSSGSSGRLSTGSVCSGTSLGDSGTHSDHDERRTGNFPGTPTAGNCRVGLPGSLLLDNYMIPPAPRPVSGTLSTPTEEQQQLRFSNSNNSSEHYIIFPSNAPVYPVSHDYINFGGSGVAGGGLNTIDENKEADIHTIKIQKPKDVIYAPVVGRKGNPCSSFRNQSGGPKASIVGDHVLYGRFNQMQMQQQNQQLKGDEEVLLRNQLQSVKEMKDQKKMFSRQNSSEANNEPTEDHSYMNLSV